MNDTPSMNTDSLQDFTNLDGMVSCVFSTNEVSEIGTGTTKRKHVSKLYWFVEQLNDKEFAVRPVNINHLPCGDPETISLETLMNRYVPDLEFYEDSFLPAVDALEDILDEGEEEYAEGRYYSAEVHFNKALGLEETNVRALFNLGLIYLALKDTDKARDMMGDILSIKTAFDGKNQHLFNEFGISLRKSGLFDEAATYYSHALNYVKGDENLYYNLARANYERCYWESCVTALEKVFEINPDLTVAHELVSIILTLANNPKLAAKNGKKEVPSAVTRQLTGIFNDYPQVNTKKINVPASLLSFSTKPNKPEKGRVRSGYEGGSSTLSFDID